MKKVILLLLVFVFVLSLVGFMPGSVKNTSEYVSKASDSGNSTLHPTGCILAPVKNWSQINVQKLKGDLASKGITALPSSIDWSSKEPPVGDQGGQSSCTAWATGYYYKTFQEGKEQHWDLTSPVHQFSPAFVYNQTNGGYDKGSSIPNALQLLIDKGCDTLAAFPYSQYDYLTQPTSQQLQLASPFKAKSYANVFQGQGNCTDDTINSLKSWLANGDTFVIAIPVYSMFDNTPNDPSYVIPPHNPSDIPRGLHALQVVGYDDNLYYSDGTINHYGAFKILNSWGTSYGYSGFANLSYDFFKVNVYEAWVMTDAITPQDFTIALTPVKQSTMPGGTLSYTIMLSSLSGFNGIVSLSVPGLPSDITYQLSSSSVAPPTNVTLTLNVGSSVSSGTYSFTISCTSSSTTHEISGIIKIKSYLPDFSISVTPISQPVIQGSSTTYTVILTAQNGFNSSVSLSASGVPTGATASFNPSSLTPTGSSTLTVSTSSSTPADSYIITITATGGSKTHKAQARLNVTQAQNTPPSTPRNFSATAGNGQVLLFWNPPSNNGGCLITEYKIYKGTSPGVESYLTTVSDSPYTDTKVTNGTTYYYYAKAVNCVGESEPSVEKSATPEQTQWVSINNGLYGGWVTSLAIDPTNTNTIYAGMWCSSIYKSTDGGDSWSAINNGLPNHVVRSLAIDPTNTNVIYAGTYGGVFKSTNGGGLWSAVNDGLTNLFASSLAIDPINSNNIYVGTFGGGVFKSTDGGNNWSQINNGFTNLSVRSLAIDQTNTSMIYAGTWGGVFKSTDGGSSWHAINDGLTNLSVRSLAIDQTNTNVLYAGGPDGVFKSTDGGSSWHAINDELINLSVSSLAIDPTNTNTIYAGGDGVFKSTDGGNNWSQINNGFTNMIIFSLAIDPTNTNTIYAGGDGVFKSTDGGNNWSQINNGFTNMIIFSLAIDPTNTNTIYVGIGWGGGIFKSTNGGASWNAINSGITNLMIETLIVDPKNTNTVYAGTRDNGLCKSTNAGDSWYAIDNGLTNMNIFSLVIDQTNTNVLYAGGSNGIFKSTNEGNSLSIINGRLGMYVVSSLAIDPTNPQIVYAGTWYDGVFKSTDGGNSWSQMNNGLTNTYVFSLAIDPTNPQTIYAGTGGGGVSKSTDGGANWENTGLTNGNVESLAIDPTNTNVLYAGSSIGVFKSTDGGSSWSWHAINDLPTITSVSSLAIDQTNTNVLYAGGPDGVFKSTDGGNSWSQINNGLTNTYVFSLAIDPTNPQTIYAGTDGGGVFKSTDGGNSWSQINNGLTNTSVRSLAIDQTNTNIIYAGTDGGVFKSTNGGASWSQINNGLTNTSVYSLAIDQTNTNVLYAGGPNGIFKSTDGGNSWSQINNGLTNTSVRSLAIDQTNTSMIYAGTWGGVFKSTDGGSSWHAINDGLTNLSVSSLAIDPTNTNTIYAGTGSCQGGDGVFKSTDGGSSWHAINDGLTNLSVSSLAIDPTNTQVIYAGTDGGGIFKSTDGGANWSQSGLASFVIDSFVIDSMNIIYAGTDGGGIFKSTDGGANWSAINDGLTDPNVGPLAIDPKNIIYAGTTRGVFKFLNTNTYTLTVNVSPSDSGTVTLNPPGGTYTAGTTVTLTANSSIRYHFVGWSGDVLSGHEMDNPLTITMDSNKIITATFAMSLTITTTSLPDGTVNTSYSATLEATGGTGTYTWSITSGNLPDGLSLNASTGEISGTPTTANTYNFTVQVSDGTQTATKNLSITINSNTISFTLHIPSGWSVISVPFDTNPSLLTTNANIQYLFYWDGNFWQIPVTLQPGIGYLIYNTSSSTIDITLTGTPTSSPFTEQCTGDWQVIGNPFTTTCSLSSTSTITIILYWDGNFWQTADPNNLQPGIGYLILTNGTGTLTFTSSP